MLFYAMVVLNGLDAIVNIFLIFFSTPLSLRTRKSQFARVTKGADLRSIAGHCAWVRSRG
jgi:hypothetical protein